MFSTRSNLALVAEAPTLYIDGNVQICPTCLPGVHNTYFQAQAAISPGLLSPAKQEHTTPAQNISIEVNPPRV